MLWPVIALFLYSLHQWEISHEANSLSGCVLGGFSIMILIASFSTLVQFVPNMPAPTADMSAPQHHDLLSSLFSPSVGGIAASSSQSTTMSTAPHRKTAGTGGAAKVIKGEFTKRVHTLRVQELCESRGGRPGLSVLMSVMVSVDVRQY